MRHVGFALSILLASAATSAAGGTAPASCGSVEGFVGEVLVGAFAPAVKLEWTVLEDANIQNYRLTRTPESCSKPNRCDVTVAKVNGSDPAMRKLRALVDTPPAGVWTYRLEVVRSRGKVCGYETTVVVPDPAPCDLATLCAQMDAGFTGEVIMGSLNPGTLEVRWLANAESDAISGYRLSRYDCSDARVCATEVATVSATGSCGVAQLHSLTDSPAIGLWTYRLEVLAASGVAACMSERTVDTTSSR